jgi:hypothetical protein
MSMDDARRTPDEGGAAAPLRRLAYRLLGAGLRVDAPDDPPDRIGADIERRAALDALAEADHLDSGY